MGKLFSQGYIKEYDAEGYPVASEPDEAERSRDKKISTLKFLKKLPISICIFAAETDKLLYVNEQGRHLLKLNPGVDITKAHLFELLVTDDVSASSLALNNLSKSRYLTCTCYSQRLGKTLQLKSNIISWRNRLARMATFQDLTESAYLKDNIADSNAIENLLLCSMDKLVSKGGKELVCELLRQLASFFEAETAYVLKLDKKLGTSYITYEWNRGNATDPEKYLYNIEVGLDFYKDMVLSETGPLIINDLEDLKKTYLLEYNWFKQRQVHNFFWMPYQVDGVTEGYLCLDNLKQHITHFQLIHTFASLIFRQIKLQELEEQYEYSKYNDSLTNLFNRQALLRDLDNLQQLNCSTGILVMGINELELLNYRLGNSYGNRLLRMAANILKTSFSSANIYRMYDDSFAVVRRGTTYELFLADVKGCVKKIEQLHKPGAALGISWNDNPKCDGEHLLHEAALMMLRNKKQRDEKLKDQNQIVNMDAAKKLKEELTAGRYKIVLQGQFNAGTGKISGVEALVRYTDLKGNLILPEHFVPQFENEGLIRYIDLYVLKQVCCLIAAWQERNIKIVPVAVNFSARTIMEPGMVNELAALADNYDVPHQHIMIEINESMARYDQEKFVEICTRLLSAGFKLCLDDFGSEYAYVQLLTLVPFYLVKFDRKVIGKLTTDKRLAAICKALMELCAQLGFKVLAIGVEDKEELKLLKSFGCQLVQGCYFGRPLEIAEFEQKNFKSFTKLIKNRDKT